jgi:glycosyltransferase involved in cell wall biosynthesis
MTATKGGWTTDTPAPPLAHRPAGRRRHVCLLSHPIAWGGTELYTVQLAATLVARGHTVTLAEFGESLFATRARLADGVRLVTLQFDVPPDQVTFSRWIRTLRGLHCDAGVFIKGQINMGSVALDLAARLCFRRYIVIEQISPPSPPAARSKRHFGIVPGIGLWRWPHIWPTYQRSFGPQRIVGVSRRLVRELREYWYPRRKLLAVPNGVDTELYRPDPAQRAATREAWGVPPAALVFGTVARLLVSHKAQDLAIDAFAKLRSKSPDHDPWYVLVGEGPDRPKLEAQAREAGVGHRVVFAGYTEQPRAAHCGLDVFVLPSKVEGTPIALLEAIACGVCPIAMDVGGVADVIPDPSLGWLVPAGDREGLLAAMRGALLQTPDERTAMGCLARRHVERAFQASEQFGKIAALVEA